MLTDRQIRSAKPRDRDYVLTDNTRTRGTGRLSLRVRPNGTKEWFFIYWRQVPGRERSQRLMVKLGTYPTLPLSDVRERASELSRLHENGVDVRGHLAEEKRHKQAEQEEAKRQGSLQDLLDSYVAWMEANGRRSAASVRTSLATYVLKPWPRLAQVKAREITPADIRDILAAMIQKGVTTHSNRVRSYLHTAFKHGLTQEHNPRDFLGRTVRFGLTSNPVAAIPRQEDYERVGERTLSAEEVKLLWDHGIHEIGLVPASTFKLELATAGQRVGELLRLTWDDVDLDEALMTIPASVAKNNREHVVPLGEMAMQILSDLSPLKRPGGPLCPGRSLIKPFHITSLNTCAERFCVELKMERFTTRDLRRTAKTLMGEAGLDKDIRDRLQNHSLHDISSKHYDRYSYMPEKRRAVAKWDRYLRRIVSEQVAGNVVELTRP